MKNKNLVFKILAIVACALSIVPLFLNYITLRSNNNRFPRLFADTAGSGDTLLVISRVLFITTIVVAFILMVGLILQFFFKNNILNWVVVGTSVFIMITATLSFVSTLLYCLSISDLGKYVWYPSIGGYVLLFCALAAPLLAYFGNREPAKKK